LDHSDVAAFSTGLNIRCSGAIGILAFLANFGYSVVYLADIPAQCRPVRSVWLRWRWSVFAPGTFFAVALEMYWVADEIY
jgi:hypothetical protein